MNLTPGQKEIGRRNFLKAVAGTPALAALVGAAATSGPKRGGPVKAALIGSGGEGKVLLKQCQQQWIDLRAICDINPKHASGAAAMVMRSNALSAMGQEVIAGPCCCPSRRRGSSRG